jgi:hypothetical protein
VDGPPVEENLAVIQTIFGENRSAISTLTRLLQTPYNTFLYGTPVTPALLRLDPIWEPLRSDPAFQKLCEESSREPARFRSTVDSNGRTIWIADAHRDDAKRFVVHAEENLTAL